MQNDKGQRMEFSVINHMGSYGCHIACEISDAYITWGTRCLTCRLKCPGFLMMSSPGIQVLACKTYNWPLLTATFAGKDVVPSVPVKKTDDGDEGPQTSI